MKESSDVCILIDFGSTFTKATAVSLSQQKVICSTMTPSTVHSDAGIGLRICYEKIKGVIGEEAFKESTKLATSSAAGGLRMIVVGLTRNLSIAAGRNAAFNAGAKVLKYYFGYLDEKDIQEIDGSGAEIILLCGGYENGNEKTVLHNAEMIGSCRCRVPIIYAGNSRIMEKVRKILLTSNKECSVVENIIPQVGELDTRPAEKLIRDIFMERITHMKGLDKVLDDLDGDLIPTPASVLQAGELLSLGTENSRGLGPLMIADVGGATTDIYSYADPQPFENVRHIGLPETYSKRTVEGDLGMRESSANVIEEAGQAEAAAAAGMSEKELLESIEKRMGSTEYLPSEEKSDGTERLLDQYLAKSAVYIAARRHAGHVVTVCSNVCSNYQTGRNLSAINLVIGTGGQIIKSSNPGEILGQVAKTHDDERKRRLLPGKSRMMIDTDYVLYAAGLLREKWPEVALQIMKNSMKEIENAN